MSTEDVLHLAAQRPFVPFRLFMRDGSVREIQFPPVIHSDGESLLVAAPVETDNPTICGKAEVVDLRQVLCMEPLPDEEQL